MFFSVFLIKYCYLGFIFCFRIVQLSFSPAVFRSADCHLAQSNPHFQAKNTTTGRRFLQDNSAKTDGRLSYSRNGLSFSCHGQAGLSGQKISLPFSSAMPDFL